MGRRRAAIAENRRLWRDLARDPGMRKSLATACQAALDSLAQNATCP